MTKTTIFRIGMLLGSVFSFSGAFGQTSATASGEFSLQGRLTTTAGAPIADGEHTLVANLYAKGSATVVYTETDHVTTSDGLFSTMIGDNGSGKLNVDAKTDYELGVAVDGQAELAPKITLASALKAITADLALNADSVGGFGVSTSANAQANTVLVLNDNAKIGSSLIDGGVVTSVNGLKGNVSLTGGGDLAVNTSGSAITLSFTGSASGLTLPFSRSVDISSGSVFSITNTLGANVASFINTGAGAAITASSNGAAAIDVQNTAGAAINATATTATDAVLKVKNMSSAAQAQLLSAANAGGSVVLDVAANGKTTINSSVANALDVSSSAGAAINATATTGTDAVLKVKNMSSAAQAQLISAANAGGSLVLDVAANGKTTINSSVANALDVSSSAGAAINATANATTDAVLKVKNEASGASAKLISALNAGGNTVLDVASSGKTTIASSVGDALDVTTSASGEAALKVTGGLKFIGAAGAGAITAGNLTTTINNSLAKANSIILVTVNGGGAVAVPLMVSSQANGSFVVSVFNNVTSLLGNVSFSYLIINQ